MITDLVCGFGLLGAYLFVVLAITAFIHLGAGPDEDDGGPVGEAPAPIEEVDLLADQPVDVLTQDAVDRRFYALTGRGGPRREWWA